MKRKIALTVVVACSLACLAGCGNADVSAQSSVSSFSIQEASTILPSGSEISENFASSASESSDFSSLQDIGTKLEVPASETPVSDAVTVTIPANLAVGSWETMDLDSTCKNNGYYSAERSETGAITFLMSPEKRDEFYKLIQSSMISGVVTTVVGDARFPYISSIDYSNDANEISVYSSSAYTDDTYAINNTVLQALFMQAADNSAQIVGPVSWTVNVYDDQTNELITSYIVSK